jgi:transcriptional regulator with XRE-family HTH domain
MPRSDDATDAQPRPEPRVEREARNWSLTDLSRRSGVSRATINRVERGRSSPTAALLGRLSGALGLALSTFCARAEGLPGVRLLRAQDQPKWRDPVTGAVHRRIAPAPGSDLPLDLIGIALPAGASVAVPASSDAFIRQVVVVLEGALTVRDGETAHELSPGDSLEFGPSSDGTFRNPSGDPCSCLVAALRT